MESAEELTTPPTPRESSEDPFEYVLKKRKNKKRGRTIFYRKNKQQNPDDVNQQNSEDIETVSADSNENQDDIEENESQISQDSQMKTQPTETSESNEPSPTTVQKKYDDTKSPPTEINSVFNTRALGMKSNTYELERFEKCVLYIFSHQHVKGFNPNLSVDKDVTELTKTFSKFGFEVLVEKDLTKEELMDKLREFSKQNFTDHGCVAVAILTIGSKDGLIWAKDDEYSELELIKHFKVHIRPTLITKPKIFIVQHEDEEDDEYSELELIKHFKVHIRPTLITKPKIFIVQASQGIKENWKSLQFRNLQLEMAGGSIQKDIDEEKQPYTLPVESDRLIIHSTYSGKPPNSDKDGSWFIQKLCEKIVELASTHDLESILTVVNREIDNNKSEHSKETNKYWLKMPVITSTLIRKLYLRKFEQKPTSYMDQTQSDISQISGETDTDVGAQKISPKDNSSCYCYLEHFEYIKQSLGYFIEDHPDDRIARQFYNVAITLGESPDFNSTKEKMLQAISVHLRDTENSHDLKYLHHYHMTD